MRAKAENSLTFDQLDVRTQVKIEKRARLEGKTPEAVAAFILDKWVGVTQKKRTRHA